jgi:RNA polymerase sigma-70 factor (ECF subfamily)
MVEHGPDRRVPPTATADDDLAGVFEERRRLLAIGYRMLGTLAEAEDAVQETYVRWYRMTDAERAAVRNPAGWLTRVMGRVCLDVLGSARARRERYVGEWLPSRCRRTCSPASPARPPPPSPRAATRSTASLSTRR